MVRTHRDEVDGRAGLRDPTLDYIIILCYTIILIYHAILLCLLYYAMLCYAMLCYAMICFTAGLRTDRDEGDGGARQRDPDQAREDVGHIGNHPGGDPDSRLVEGARV